MNTDKASSSIRRNNNKENGTRVKQQQQQKYNALIMGSSRNNNARGDDQGLPSSQRNCSQNIEMIDLNNNNNVIKHSENFVIDDGDEDDDYNGVVDIFHDEEDNNLYDDQRSNGGGRDIIESYSSATVHHHSKWIWLHASYHCLVTILGTGILGFPYAFAYLGFIGGLILIVVVTIVSMYNALILVGLQDVHQYTYSQLADSIMGVGWARYYIRPFQFFAFFPTTCVLILIGGQAITSMTSILMNNNNNNNNNNNSSTTGDDETTTESEVILDERVWIFVVGIIVMFLSFAPDLSSAWIISFIGSITAILIPICCVVGSYAYATSVEASDQDEEGNENVDINYNRPVDDATNNNLDYMFGIMTSFGSVLFGYGFHSLVPDIQTSLHDKKTIDAHYDMKKAIYSSFAWVFPSYVIVGIVGYYAFGSSVEQDILSSISNNDVLSSSTMYLIWIFILFKVTTEAAAYNQAAFTLIKEAFFTTRATATQSSSTTSFSSCQQNDEQPSEQSSSSSSSSINGHHVATTEEEEEEDTTVIPSSSTSTTTSKKCYCACGGDLFIRIVYVMTATIITIAIPFFSDLASICGAIGITPLSFVIPLVLWNKKYGEGQEETIITSFTKFRILLHKLIIILFLILAICALIGSIDNIMSLETTSSTTTDTESTR